MNRVFFTLILVFSLKVVNCQIAIDQNITAFKNSVSRIELVRVLPTVSAYKSRFRTKEYYFQASIIDDRKDKFFNEELISQPVQVDSSAKNNFLDLVYSDSTTLFQTRCYMPRHGILIWGHNQEYLGFIEICFECHAIRTTPGVPKPKNLDYPIFEKLELLFKGFGLVDEKTEK